MEQSEWVISCTTVTALQILIVQLWDEMSKAAVDYLVTLMASIVHLSQMLGS